MKRAALLSLLLVSMEVYAYETVYQAAQEFKKVVNSGKSPSIKHKAAHIIQQSFDTYYREHSGIVLAMINRYYTAFGESPFTIKSTEKDGDQYLSELETYYWQACEEVKKLKEKVKSLEITLVQEKNRCEKLYQELSSLQFVVSEEEHTEHAQGIQGTLADIYEQLKQAFQQYEQEFGSVDMQKTLSREVLQPHEQREEDLKYMLKQWDAIMHQLRLLNQKAEAYEIIKQTYKQREEDLKKISEQRDLLERQVRDLHRKFDKEQAKNTIALNDAHSQLEAARNQLAETKNQLVLAKRQQQITVPKNQELEKTLQSERLAYEGALSDERMQRQKMRQQIQELQKRLEVERASYEKRIMALEQEVVMLIERLPSGQDVRRTGSPLTKHEITKEDVAQKDEKRRI